MSPTDSKRLVIKGGTLIDGTGRARVPNGAIVIEGHEIVRVANGTRSGPTSTGKSGR